ncbi:hypothetical protein Agub_g310, partial [Astrephomene gubernaculifera]
MAPKKQPQPPAAKAQRAPANDGYEFSGNDERSELMQLANKLKSPNKGKDALVKLLKQLRTALEALPQDVEALGAAKEILPQQLYQHATHERADKDVRLYSAACLVHLMRVFAPDIPYDDEELKVLFGVLLDCWSRLADTDAATFDLCCTTLQVFADVKFYVPLLDLGDPQLLTRTFATLLQAARPESLEALQRPVLEVLGGMLEEEG